MSGSPNLERSPSVVGDKVEVLRYWHNGKPKSETKSTYFSNHVEKQILLIEHRNMSEDCDWLNKYPYNKLTANGKTGIGKRKREADNESEYQELVRAECVRCPWLQA